MRPQMWEELGPKWPEAFWDDWLREPPQVRLYDDADGDAHVLHTGMVAVVFVFKSYHTSSILPSIMPSTRPSIHPSVLPLYLPLVHQSINPSICPPQHTYLQRRARQFLRPEVSRTYTFGVDGVSRAQFFNEYLGGCCIFLVLMQMMMTTSWACLCFFRA